jgi:hypothetical protein
MITLAFIILHITQTIDISWWWIVLAFAIDGSVQIIGQKG